MEIHGFMPEVSPLLISKVEKEEKNLCFLKTSTF